MAIQNQYSEVEHPNSYNILQKTFYRKLIYYGKKIPLQKSRNTTKQQPKFTENNPIQIRKQIRKQSGKKIKLSENFSTPAVWSKIHLFYQE